MKQFSIFKKDNEGNEKKPTHAISAKIGDKYVEIGACWTKDGKSGKFLSCTLKEAYQDRRGFHVEVDIPETKVEDTSGSPF